MHLILGLGRFEKDDVGAFGLEIAATIERLIETVHGARVGTRQNQNVRVSFGIDPARIFIRASSREITCLPRVCPHFFGLT